MSPAVEAQSSNHGIDWNSLTMSLHMQMIYLMDFYGKPD